MIEIFFCVKGELVHGETLKVVGSLQQLGNWKVQHGVILHPKRNGWESGPVYIQSEQSFQFKIIKQTHDKVDWQMLPNNSNRKFKSKHSIKLYLEWSKPEGKVSKLPHQKVKKNHFQETSSDEKTSVKLIKDENFDPYLIAYYSHSSDEEEGDLVIRKRKISDELSTTNIDFQELFYRTQPFQILYTLMKKNKIYLISHEINLESRFHQEIQGKIKEIGHYYLTKWMTFQTLKNENKAKSKHTLKSIETLFEIEEEEILHQNLHSKTSYFVVLDIQSAIVMKNEFSHLPTCIYLSYSEFQEAKTRIKQLPKVEFICFDRQQQNQKFAQFLDQSNIFLFQSKHANLLKKQVPTLQQLALMLQCDKKKDNLIINAQGALKQAMAIESFMRANTISFVEGGMIERCGDFVQKLIKRKKQKCLIVFVVKEDRLSAKAVKLKDYKNVVFIYNNFKNIVIQNCEYHPMRKFQETIDMFRMKAKLLADANGGEIVQKHNSLSYIIPEDKLEMATKIFSDFKTTAKSLSFIKVTRRGKKIKAVWNIAEEARAVRTLCEIKYTNFGNLGGFNIISDNLTLRQFKDTFKLLVDHYPKLFEEPKHTKINYFSYGGKVMATCHILPESLSEDQDA